VLIDAYPLSLVQTDLMGVLECGGDIVSMVCGVLVLLLMGEG
jgi:hypothetical protein